MDCSMPDFPVLHYVPERAQTHIHWIDNAIQPSHPLPSPSPPAFHLHLQGRQSNQHRRRPARFTNCPQTPKQIRLLPTSLHGNLEFIINRQKPRKMTPEIQCDLRLQRDAPQKPTNISLKLFSESSLQTQLLPRLSLRTMFSCCHHRAVRTGRSIRRTVSLVCLITGKFFYLLLQLLTN